MDSRNDRWPELPYESWKDSAATLHMWTQIVGKVRMVQSPWVNHSWHVTLYVTPRGLTTSTIPHGRRAFRIDLDFVQHLLVVETSDGSRRTLPLEPQTTADFYARLMRTLDELGLPVKIDRRPNEVERAIPFDRDVEHASYDGDAVQRFWRALTHVDRVFRIFRARFIGKSSPVHFFWGSFDLAVTRFSGRTAPAHPGGYPNMPLEVMREAYSHEVSSAGFWPGGDAAPAPIFYSYAYPTPEGMSGTRVRPDAAAWNEGLGEFVLAYDDVRRAASPEETLLDFLQSTYEAAADRASWDREALEQETSPPALGTPMNGPTLKTLGVLGGIGPQATIDFEARLHRACRSVVPPRGNAGYPPMVTVFLRHAPVVLDEEGLPRRPLTLDPRVLDAAARLGAWADFLVIVSNTPHHFLDAIREAADCDVLSMIDVTIEALRRRPSGPVGLTGLGIPRVHADRLDAEGLETLVPPESVRETLDRAILRCMEGEESPELRDAARAAVDAVRSAGAVTTVLGCTEIPLLLGDEADAPDLVNPAQLLAEAAVRFAMSDS